MLAKLTSYSCFRACYNFCNEHSSDNNENEDEQHLPTSSTALQGGASTTETLLFRNNLQHATNAIATRWYNLATCTVTPSVAIFNNNNIGVANCGGGGGGTTNPEKIKDMDMLMMRHMKPASLEDERMFMVRTFSKCSTDEDNETMQMLLKPSMDNVMQQTDECLLCLEEFTDTSPVASTVCTCGVNSTRAHLHCLTMWRNTAGKVMCPICSEEVFFDEQKQPVAQDEEEEDRL